MSGETQILDFLRKTFPHPGLRCCCCFIVCLFITRWLTLFQLKLSPPCRCPNLVSKSSFLPSSLDRSPSRLFVYEPVKITASASVVSGPQGCQGLLLAYQPSLCFLIIFLETLFFFSFDIKRPYLHPSKVISANTITLETLK